MAFSDWVVGGLVGTFLLKTLKDGNDFRGIKDERKQTPCTFDDIITESVFSAIVRHATRIRRIKRVSIRGPVVEGTVLSQSGISEWNFTIDFNDYGRVSGKYWISSENHDSNIPERVAARCSGAIKATEEYADAGGCVCPDGKGYFVDTDKIRHLFDLKNLDVDYNDDVSIADNKAEFAAAKEAEKSELGALRKALREAKEEALRETEEEALREAEREERRRKRKARRKKHRKLIAVFVLILIMALAGLFIYYENSIRIPAEYSPDDLIGENYETVVRRLTAAGFSFVSSDCIADLPVEKTSEEGLVTSVSFGFFTNFNKYTLFPSNIPVKVQYHAVEEVKAPISSSEAKKLDYAEAVSSFEQAGFTNIRLEVKNDIITGWLNDMGEVAGITINGDPDFYANASFRADSEVIITYHDYKTSAHKWQLPDRIADRFR